MAYSLGQTDYWLEPILLADAQGKPLGRIQDGDSVVFCCRRGEREVQLTEAFVEPTWSHFPRREFRDLTFVPLTLYHDKFRFLPIAFPPTRVTETLGEVVSAAGLRQLHVAESDKFAHVTFFLNGGSNGSFPGEQDVNVPSSASQAPSPEPQLGLDGVVEEVLRGLDAGYELIVANLANGDVIGHWADFGAKVRCAELLDAALGRITEKGLAAGYVTLITADHGILETGTTTEGTPNLSHTTSRVPLVVVATGARPDLVLQSGSLADVAPTVLAALGLARPDSMTGNNLTGHDVWGGRRRVLLLILDGWGIGPPDGTNPIHRAHTPVWRHLLDHYPSTSLAAAGLAVGLRAGAPGNSEAGHMNIGAGRPVSQDDTRLETALRDGSFYQNEPLLVAIDRARIKGSRLHLLGLLSWRSSHGSIEYPLALLRMAAERGVNPVYLHWILDGRSTPPGSAPELLADVESRIAKIGPGTMVTCVGRGLALDRDGDDGRTKRAYDALVYGRGALATLAGDLPGSLREPGIQS